MATSYALPLNGSATRSHGHGHTRSHHRKAVPDRLDLAPASLSSLMSVGSESQGASNSNRPHTYSRSMPQGPWSEKRLAEHEYSHSTYEPYQAEIPHSNLPSTDMLHRQFGAEPTKRVAEGSYRLTSLRTENHGPAESYHLANTGKTLTIPEIISSLLLPLPFALTALILTSPLLQPQTDPTVAKHLLLNKEPGAMDNAVGFVPSFSWIAPSSITSATLLMLGLFAKARGSTESMDRRKRSHSSLGHRNGNPKTNTDKLTSENARRVVARVLAIGLPFLAASAIGGERVAVLSLVSIATDLAGARNLETKLSWNAWKRLIITRKWVIAAFILQMLTDVLGITGSGNAIWELAAGYLAIAVSIFALPPPYPTISRKAPGVTSPAPKSMSRTSAVSTPWESTSTSNITSKDQVNLSPLISTSKDVNLTILAGGVTAIPGLIWALFYFHTSTSLLFSRLAWGIFISGLTCLSLTFANPRSLLTERKLGLAIGLFLPIFVRETLVRQPWSIFACQGVLVGLFWTAINLDTHTASPSPQHASPVTHRHITPPNYGTHSAVTGILLSATSDWPLLHSILVEKDSRRILYFMSLNFAFMLVQTFYAIVTGSLGLLSDSIHMFFDCLALVVGLCAAVMSKWPPSIRFPYGFGKMDTLAGFANGIFLMLISVEIIYEAIERLVEGGQMQRITELLTVSSLGLIVNLVGMVAFGHAHHGHGHSHAHGGHAHSHDTHNHSHEVLKHSHDSHGQSQHGHDHSHQGHLHLSAQKTHTQTENKQHDHSHSHSHSRGAHHQHSQTAPSIIQGPLSPLPFSVPPTPSAAPAPTNHGHTHSHGHSHSHSHHGNENMQGIYLHILADTLGSVAVVISTVLIHYTGWAGFDPLASCLIAGLIFASAIPLVTSSAKRLLLAVPEDTEFDLREALAGVGGLKGVVGVTVPRFWMGEGEGGKVGGVMHVVAGRGVDMEEVRERAVGFLAGRGMDVLVQVEREGDGRCWCGGGNSNSGVSLGGIGGVGNGKGARNM